MYHKMYRAFIIRWQNVAVWCGVNINTTLGPDGPLCEFSCSNTCNFWPITALRFCSRVLLAWWNYKSIKVYFKFAVHRFFAEIRSRNTVTRYCRRSPPCPRHLCRVSGVYQFIGQPTYLNCGRFAADLRHFWGGSAAVPIIGSGGNPINRFCKNR